jgi:hypothetical protein
MFLTCPFCEISNIFKLAHAALEWLRETSKSVFGISLTCVQLDLSTIKVVSFYDIFEVGLVALSCVPLNSVYSFSVLTSIRPMLLYLQEHHATSGGRGGCDGAY